jgi:hypothetical protein
MTIVCIDTKFSNSYFAHSTKVPVTDFSQLVQNHLPQTLKRVSIFEEFSESLARILAVHAR